MSPRASLDEYENPVPIEIRSPDRPSRSYSLYRLHTKVKCVSSGKPNCTYNKYKALKYRCARGKKNTFVAKPAVVFYAQALGEFHTPWFENYTLHVHCVGTSHKFFCTKIGQHTAL